ncbi:iron ABC transporter permease [Glutamicibacter uratoxydans]|uniref:Iron ABC transporter permease n=1 Tax=Glutamicibacter uratoxydans TaxID=43667 RepID=A0A4Y4DUY2_GLUUR|nr:iron chelate uptake ABC transporter family permease subunit [Glutamicibacter uratoxydans]GED07674.1 iron ABC transporter permease [Glutamicibacter uratoxydans]
MTASPSTTAANAPHHAKTGDKTSGKNSGPRTIGGRKLSTKITATVILLVLLCAAVAASLLFGARSVSLSAVIDALRSFDPENGDQAVVASRFARTIGGLVVGAALGLAGAGLQGLTRNPLADTGILGLNAGASLAVVLSMAFLGATSLNAIMIAAFLGAAIVMALVYLVASVGREGATPIKLALGGAALAVGIGAITNAVLMTSKATLGQFRMWQIGSLSASPVETYLAAIPVVLLGAVIVLATARACNAVAMGDDTATALGFNLGRWRLAGSIGIVLLAGAATAVAGPITFVGLMIPHAVRLLVGSDYRWLMPVSVIAGPILLLAADTLGRVIAPPTEIQVGVMCALLGGPIFIIMMRSGMKSVSL